MGRKVLIFQHVPHEILGTFDPLLKSEGIRMKYINFSRQTDVDINLDSYDGLIILGGPMSVNQSDQYPHLEEEIRWIKKALEKDLFVLGICLGAQLLSRALGGKVSKNPVTEIGWYDVELTDGGLKDPLLKHFNSVEKIFQWHGDTFSIPKDCVHLAKSKGCENQAFRYGKKVYGLQFHLEVSRELIERWLNVEANALELARHKDYIDPDLIREETENCVDNLKHLSNKTFSAFLKIVGIERKRFKFSSR